MQPWISYYDLLCTWLFPLWTPMLTKTFPSSNSEFRKKKRRQDSHFEYLWDTRCEIKICPVSFLLHSMWIHPILRVHINLGRVVRKPVNANPGLKVNRSINFSCIKMLFAFYFLFSLRLIKIQKRRSNNINRKRLRKVEKLKSKFSLILG